MVIFGYSEKRSVTMGLFGKRLVTAVKKYWIQLEYRSYPEWIHSDLEKVATSSNFFAKVKQDGE